MFPIVHDCGTCPVEYTILNNFTYILIIELCVLFIYSFDIRSIPDALLFFNFAMLAFISFSVIGLSSSSFGCCEVSPECASPDVEFASSSVSMFLKFRYSIGHGLYKFSN